MTRFMEALGLLQGGELGICAGLLLDGAAGTAVVLVRCLVEVQTQGVSTEHIANIIYYYDWRGMGLDWCVGKGREGEMGVWGI
jgi:hypothetical protein